MKVIKNVLLEIVTLILMMINLYMFFIQSGIARIISRPHRKSLMLFGNTFDSEFDYSDKSLVVVYIVSVKVFKRTIENTFRVVILLAVECDYTGTYKCNNGSYFVAVVLYIVYLVQTIVNIRKF